MCKKISVLAKRIFAVLMVLTVLSATLLSISAQKADTRFTAEHLKAYYNFEDAGKLLADASGNNNTLAVGWGYTPNQIDADTNLSLGKGAKFNSVSAVTPLGSVYNKKDFLDNMDTYTLSMFFKNTEACTGGILFNNKFWGESGVRISVNKWPDPAATGQVELYLDYNYTDANGTECNYRNCVKFIPDIAGSVDQSWQHLALTVDKPNHTIKLYYNGALVHENSNMQALLADSQKYPMAFGAMLDPQWPSTDSPFDGSLDEIRIYDFAATDSVVSVLSRYDLQSSDTDVKDVNSDGEIDIRDLVRLKKIVLNMTDADQSVDINGESAVDTLDLTELVKYILSV